MRNRLALVSFVMLTAGISAQTATYQAWDMHPDATSFTSRGNIGSRSGEVLQGVHTSTSRGVLDVAGVCRISRFNTITQDQNCSTRERFNFIVRTGSDATGPTVGSRGVLGTVVGVLLPPSTSTGACAWSVTSTLTASTAIRVPSVRHWSYGIQLNVGGAANWTMDGQSVHATSSTSSANSHRNHSRNEDQAWQIVGTATMMASHPSQKRSWRMTTFVLDGTVMKLRSGGRQGYGGSFPKASTSSAPLAWDARLNGGSGSAGFSSIVAIGTTRASAGAPVSRAGAHLYVHGHFFFFYGPKANSSGVAIVPLVSHVPASVTGFPLPIHLQGALGTMAVLKLTNSQTLKL